MRMTTSPNLNDALITNDSGPHVPLSDPSRAAGSVSCHFRGIRPALSKFISSYPAIVGCVAWLTDETILEVLASRESAVIILQKEDFLRPDLKTTMTTTDKGKLRDLYGKLRGATRFDFPKPLSECSVCGDNNIEGVRCVGSTRGRDATRPTCHHKFIVGGVMVEHVDLGSCEFVPEAVWTGSFNFTENSRRSLENAIIVHDKTIAEAYTKEFAQVAALSEPLDWTSEWIEPEWRIGT